MGESRAIRVCLSLDIEERFHSHLTPVEAPRLWRLHDRIASLVDWLYAQGKPATFFVVGELAEAYPDLLRRMTAAGNEVGVHTYSHLRLDKRTANRCRLDITRGKQVVEALTGIPVRGFRAPSWSAATTADWLWDHLTDLGFEYDSSLFPVPTGMYGSFATPPRPFWLRPDLLELPPAVHVLGPLRVPYGGGFYFRCYPDPLTRALVRADARAGRTPVLYVHPWDFEPAGEVQEQTVLKRVVGNFRVHSAWRRFTTLLCNVETMTLADRCRELRREKGRAGHVRTT